MDPIVYTPIITTLYDLIEALQEQVAPEDDAVVTAAVVHLFNADYVRWPHAIKKGGMDPGSTVNARLAVPPLS